MRVSNPSREGAVCLGAAAFFRDLHLFALRQACEAELDGCPVPPRLEFVAAVDRTGPASSVLVVPKDCPRVAAQTVGLDLLRLPFENS